ncbi:hypothetical protein ACFQ0K_15520 [Nocardioides caeni]|uniref:Nuclear transport factor 2 family protein n=1 Tax=Nocardioides caeni TaxID=574700 RepID=A0A4S8N226_9ACTN|nr:hypothetical protein [Nocardioides caeni]THV09451.1 hypothetical protein E9934_16080 [Nocardioides caeni]
MDRRLLAALVLPLALTACGDDSRSSDDRTSDDATTTGPAGAPEAAGDLTDQDAAAIEETILDFLLTGECDLATDDYLRDIALFADDDATRDEACGQWEDVFSEPLFTADDVVLSELSGEDGVATILVGSDIAPDITTLYQLTLVDGAWLVSGDEYNTDGL